MLQAKDTRTVHSQYFRGLTPPSTPYYAGNYRGQDFPCLKNYGVRIPSDPRVGHQPQFVPRNMAALAVQIERALTQCDLIWAAPDHLISPAEKLAKVVRAAAAVFVYFLEIHPYANGNGHAGRFILIAVLARHGVNMRRWHMDPRPPDPPYGVAIAAYRSGQTGLLERFVLSCI